ncbi:MAG: CehA/McbA family metallohydrolase [Acidobacteriota bacterium]
MTERIPFISLLALAVMLAGPACQRAGSDHWFRGNLHTHTTNSDDGDASPETAVNWYRSHGYQFLAITDHNVLTAVEDLRGLSDGTFLLIPGMEVTDRANDIPIHVLALGLRDGTLKPAGGSDALGCLQNNVTAVRAAGAVPIMCHPNWGWAYGSEELLRVRDCVFFEVLNAHPGVNNAGGNGRPGTEQIWDDVLSRGKKLYGFGTDDMHAIATYPGKSWVMVRAPELSEKAILAAFEKGDFYVSTGVVLESIRVRRAKVRLRIRAEKGATLTTLFIGSGGRILGRVTGPSPAFKLPQGERYVRAKVTDGQGRVALTQPLIYRENP